MYHRLYFHIAWTTRDRTPLIDAAIAQFLEKFLRIVASQEQAYILALGIVQTHVHIVVRAHPTTKLPRLLQRLKGGSATVARRDYGKTLRWAQGYSIHSVSYSVLPVACSYVHNQAQRHPEERIEGWEAEAASAATAEKGL
jgi:putative transposase